MYLSLLPKPRSKSIKCLSKLLLSNFPNNILRKGNIHTLSLLSTQYTSILLRLGTLAAIPQLALRVVLMVLAHQCHLSRCILNPLVNQWLRSLLPFAVSHPLVSQHMD